ncbi:MAG: Fpg/Nei family DNA glycosylase [Acidobacteriota bacterium]|nr:Fpg/Nei family DNA glycosylase [Acidobacteriota bacterium]
MPEGNEIHRWAERHETAFAGKLVRVDGPQGRFTDSGLLDGRKLRRVMAVGKHLGYDFGAGRILHIHLGLQGDFTEGKGSLPPVKGALRLRLWNPAAVTWTEIETAPALRRLRYSQNDGSKELPAEQIAWVELRGPMDCTVYDERRWNELLERLGPDPLNGDGPERVLERMAKSRKPVGALLMDQEVAAGIGNIYRAELLFRARLSPFVPGREVPAAVARSIWKDAKALMRAGMVDRRIVTTEKRDRPSYKLMGDRGRGSLGVVLPEELHYVYRRHGKPCLVCGAEVKKQEMEGRNLYWCPSCQA